MRIIYLLVLLVFTNSIKSNAQQTDTCNIWKNYKKNDQSKKYDTLQIKGYYYGTWTNLHYQNYTNRDPGFKFQQSLEKHFKNLKISLGFKIIDCEKIYILPLAYKAKYFYKLFPNQNKQGKLEKWQEDQELLITIVRYNRFYARSQEQIIIVIDISEIKNDNK